MQSTRPCSIDGCERQHVARGWCATHYARWKRIGSTSLATRQVVHCSAQSCQKLVLARGWCRTHYTRWYETGSVELGARTGERKPSAPIDVRFWAKVDKHGGTEYLADPLVSANKVTGECWAWLGGKTTLGYGSIWDNSRKKPQMAHRVSLELASGAPVDPTKVIDHLCRNASCVNPQHLEVVTVSINTKRGLAPINGSEHNRVKTHCPQGHPYSEANTYRYKNGSRSARVCRTCAITRTQERRKKRASHEDIQ